MIEKNENIKLLYISKYLLPPEGDGVGSRGFHLMKEISSKISNITIITSNSNHLGKTPDFKSLYFHDKSSVLNLFWLKTFKYKKSKSLGRIISWIDFEIKLLFFIFFKKILFKPDVVIISSLSLLTIISGLVIKIFFKVKIIFEVRDIWPLTLTEEGGFSKFNPLILILSFIERIGYRYSDLIIGTMPNLKEHVENVLGYEKETFHIPMGFKKDDLEKNENLNENFFDEDKLKEKFIVGYAGTIGITNALHIFFETISSLRDEKNIHFLIFGDGDLKKEYINKYGKLNNVTFMPRVKKINLNSALSRCDLLYLSTLPSKVWEYGQSLNKIIDYMLAARPILASYSGYKSMINESKCGVFIPAGDEETLKSEIKRFSKMPSSELEKLGKNGKNWVLLNNDYKVLAEKYYQLINNISS